MANTSAVDGRGALIGGQISIPVGWFVGGGEDSFSDVQVRMSNAVEGEQ